MLLLLIFLFFVSGYANRHVHNLKQCAGVSIQRPPTAVDMNAEYQICRQRVGNVISDSG